MGKKSETGSVEMERRAKKQSGVDIMLSGFLLSAHKLRTKRKSSLWKMNVVLSFYLQHTVSGRVQRPFALAVLALARSALQPK